MSLPKALFTNTGVMLEDQVATARPAIRFRSNLATMTDNPTLEATEIDLRPIEEMFTGGSPTEYGYEESEIYVQPTGMNSNYNPAGWSLATHVVFHSATTQSAVFYGFEPPGADQPRMKRFSVSGGLTLILHSENVAAPDSSKIKMGDSLVFVGPGDSGLLMYSIHAQRWYVVITALTDVVANISLGGGTVTSYAITDAQARAGHIRVTSGGGSWHGMKEPQSRIAASAIKLLQFADTTLVANNVGGADRPILIDGYGTGENIRFLPGGHALLMYEWWSSNWRLIPISNYMRWSANGVTATALTFNGDTNDIWGGTLTPSFTYSSSGTRTNCRRRIFFPAGSITSLALSTQLDPTGLQAANFTGSGNAHVMIVEYEELSAIRHCFTTVRRVTKL